MELATAILTKGNSVMILMGQNTMGQNTENVRMTFEELR
jgi:hypothetical protein